MKKSFTCSCLSTLIFLFVFSQLIFAQSTSFSENFESGTASSDWGVYRFGEENVVAVPMAEAPQALAGGGDYVGYLQDIDVSYTGAAIALAGDTDMQNYSIEGDVYCYVNQPVSAYTGLVVYGDSTKQIYIKLVADFDGDQRLRLFNNKLDFQTFQYTFDHSFRAEDVPGGIPTEDGWHHMKIEVRTIDDTRTGFWCYFDGELLGGGPVYDESVHRMSSGQFGLYSFQQDDDGIAGYYDNIVVTPLGSIFTEDFESGTASSDWGVYRFGEENVVAVPMAEAPQALAGGGDYVGYLQDIDVSYTGAAIALAGDTDMQNYSIEGDVYCYVNQPVSAYTGLVVYGDSTKQIYIKLVADFDGDQRLRLFNNKLDFQTFQYTFDHSFRAEDVPGGIPTEDGWHHMKIEVRTIDDTRTGFWCYFDGELLGGGPVYDESVHRMSSGQFGLYSFQQDDDGIAGYFDNIVVQPIDPIVSVEDNYETEVPKDFTLLQNYPNPFNPETNITFSLPESRRISLIIYDLLGREIRTLLSTNLSAGHHTVTWDGKDNIGKMLSSGIYIYTLKYGKNIQSRKMILMK